MNVDNNEKNTMKNSDESSSRFLRMTPAAIGALLITTLLMHIINQGFDLILILGLMDCSVS